MTALTCLPLEEDRFEESMFRDLFEVTRDALLREEFLPALGGGHVSAEDGRLARTQELRDLLEPTQLAALEGETRPLRWVDGQVSQDRTPELRQYLMRVLEMGELTPEALLSRLDKAFLESQSDGWTQGLYEFFGSQTALRPRLGELPIVRLANGSHVSPKIEGDVQAFLPGPVETDFPTVREAVCRSEGAREFLKSLNLTEPDPVDNVIRNVLPKYRDAETDVSDPDYASDVERMVAAAATDSQSQRNKLVKALRETPWVKAVDAGRGRTLRARPEEVYVATERLRGLFAGIEDVRLLDSRIACLRGEAIRELLERSGAARYLQPMEVPCDLSWDRLSEIRRGEGLERATWWTLKDVGIRGLDLLLEKLPTLEPGERRSRAASLWDALRDLHERRGAGTFEAEYTWGYYQERKTATFDAAFVRVLNERQWIPEPSGGLLEPASITFDEVGWPPNGFLESKIRFKPPLVERLAKEVGLEPGLLDLLRRLGVTSEAELRERLHLGDESPPETASGGEGAESEEGESPGAEGDGAPRTSSNGDTDGDRTVSEGDGAKDEGTGSPGGDEAGSRSGATGTGGATEGSVGNGGRGEQGPGASRFVSYVGVVGERADSDPDGLEHARRMELEAAAIEFILSREPDWRRTPSNNAGFDLYRGASMAAATEWCEVKAMTGSLEDRPVGLSRVQFEWAREHGDAYWLYVVECAGTGDAQAVRIQDPAGKAMTFTFDCGWRAVAVDACSQGKQ